MENNRPDSYRDTERCENCGWHDEDWKFGNLLFTCRHHDFSHQSENEMVSAVCDNWVKEGW
jgi:hypothetical protein